MVHTRLMRLLLLICCIRLHCIQAEPEAAELPSEWESKCNELQRLVLVGADEVQDACLHQVISMLFILAAAQCNTCGLVYAALQVRCLRPDRVIFCATSYVANALGRKVTSVPASNGVKLARATHPHAFLVAPGYWSIPVTPPHVRITWRLSAHCFAAPPTVC
jgi:hypothetical protein